MRDWRDVNIHYQISDGLNTFFNMVFPLSFY
jgi:hypothetical protein